MNVNLIVGGQRCGSTYLFELLNKTNFFRVPNITRPEPKWFLKSDLENKNYEDYFREVFSITDNNLLSTMRFLEKSTSYFVNIKSIKCIKKILREPKIVIILRNPTNRAVSHWKFSRQNKIEKYELSEALNLEMENRYYDSKIFSSNPFAYLTNGKYFNYLPYWMENFNNVKVIFLEEFISNKKILIELLQFLEITEISMINMINWPGKVLNQSYQYEIEQEIVKKINNFYKPYNQKLSILLNRELPF